MDLPTPLEIKYASGEQIFANDAFDLVHNGQVGPGVPRNHGDVLTRLFLAMDLAKRRF